MKVDIWSDIRCPFCYIGKRKFENALKNFDNKEEVDVIWHSFQLDPSLKTQPETDIIDYFCKIKGLPRDQAEQMLVGARQMGIENGLEFNIENSIVANSFKAHQLLQYSKSLGKANEIKEVLFEAQFRDFKNIDDLETLLQLAISAGLDKEETRSALNSEGFAGRVKQDEMAAQQIGVRGVPFFVFNKKYSVSGAQTEETFLEVLEKVWDETVGNKNQVNLKNGDSCESDAC